MITDAPPPSRNRAGFLESDQIRTLDLPQNGRLLPIAKSVESAMKAERCADVRRACAEFLAQTSDFYRTPTCGIRVLAARPLRVREHWTTELFGDYNPETMLIRVWLRTAVRKQVTSFGTFLSTLCHEFCHHLDYQEFGVSRLVAHPRLLRAHRRALPPCAGYAAEAAVLGGDAGRALADRLAADESRHLKAALLWKVWRRDGAPSSSTNISREAMMFAAGAVYATFLCLA